MTLSGRFAQPGLTQEHRLKAGEGQLLGYFWDEAFVALGLADMRSIDAAGGLEIDGQQLTFEPGTRMPALLKVGMSASLPAILAGENPGLDFELRLRPHGSRSLRFYLLARTPRPTFIRAGTPPVSMAPIFPRNRL